MKKSFLFVAVALLALASGFLFRSEQTGTPLTRDVSTSADAAANPALQVSLATLDNGKASLAQWQGKVLVVNFWATWCAPCRKEIPEFVKMQTELEAKGLQFVGIAIDDVEQVRTYAKQIGINYPILVGEIDATELGRALGNEMGALPYTVIFDRGGRVVKTVLGGTNEAHLAPILQPLL